MTRREWPVWLVLGKPGILAWPGALPLGYRPDMPGIVIMGTGFGGTGMGIVLKQADFHERWARTRRAGRADSAGAGRS